MDTIFKTLRVKATMVSVRLRIFSVRVNKYQQSQIKETFEIKRWRHSENNQVLYSSAIMDKSLQKQQGGALILRFIIRRRKINFESRSNP
jgi:hypothetical protein